MLKKILYVLIVLCFLSFPAHSQTITAVTGTIMDPQGLPYGDGTVTATLVGTSGGASPTVTATGAPILAPSTAATDRTGLFNMGLIANASITPASTTYTFRFCARPTPAPFASTTQSCFTITGVTITGSSQDLSATANASAVSLAQTWNPSRIFATLPAAGVASLSATTMTTAPAIPASGTSYTFTGYVTQTVLGMSCAGNTTIVLNVIYQDPNAASPQTQAIATFTVTTNGTLGIVPLTANVYAGDFSFIAKAGTAVQYSTTYTAGGSCSPAPAVQVFPKLELQ
jgi:hypothetical protein